MTFKKLIPSSLMPKPLPSIWLHTQVILLSSKGSCPSPIAEPVQGAQGAAPSIVEPCCETTVFAFFCPQVASLQCEVITEQFVGQNICCTCKVEQDGSNSVTLLDDDLASDLNCKAVQSLCTNR